MSSPDTLILRPPRTIPAIVLALFALVIGGLGAWIFGGKLINHFWPSQVAETMQWLASIRLNDIGIAAIAVALALLGLCLLLCALIPGDPANREVCTDDLPGKTAMSRRDFARQVQRRVELVDGVSKVRVAFRGRKLRVSIATPIDAIDSVKQRAIAVVNDTIERFRPVRPVRPQIRVQQVR
ncbi:DUF6286 domain-containing protein [Corynebacterium freiburgense]|uniref:DUF6286 domain-containing protein n=1 Tax=Corynebacterium freiburgense TaxID=556548 RepID=UPI0003FE4050|nr:DUF6286 domain-containing protein [Corynebacterium freiburgense]WJZ01973.1 hypothetical protein CFREI_03350 [Corynebacterium freiburgense]